MPGETGPIIDTIPLSIQMVLGGCFGIAVYNSIEIYISIFRTFARPQGLYFWSAIAANTGIPLVALSTLLRDFGLAPAGPMAIIYVFGWWLMVTGQSFVLYSRMHLVMSDPRKLRWLLYMIISAFIVFQLTTSVLFVFVNFEKTPDHGAIVAFDIIERTQLVAFTLQESLLSGLYVYESADTLKPMEITKGYRVRRLFHELVGLCVLVCALDVSLVITQFTNHFHVQTAYKPVVYSIKLKVEAFVLNNLIRLVQPPISTYSCPLGSGPGNDGQRLGRTLSTPWWMQRDSPVDLGENLAATGGQTSTSKSLVGRNKISASKKLMGLLFPKR
ncbi:hypothetical protein GGS20DRAFT_506967 [Poronia punctata]|nr:hypothetical protein GGS20DRAFT_506967 [Poronia punctata]